MKKLTSSLLVTVLLAGIISVSSALCVPTMAKTKTVKTGFNKSRITIITGETYKLKAKDSNKRASKFKSYDKNVASVSKNGLVTAKKQGTATIYGIIPGQGSAECVITVQKPKQHSKNIILTPKLSTKLKIYNTTLKVTKWESKNQGVAKVNKYGKVTAVAKGKTVITATISKTKYKWNIIVSDNDVTLD